MGRRRRRGGAAGLNRPDTVVSRTAATPSRHRSAWQRRRTRAIGARPAVRAGRGWLAFDKVTVVGRWRIRVGAAAGAPDRETGAGLVTAHCGGPVKEPEP